MVVEVWHDDVAEGVGGGVVRARQLVQLRTSTAELGHQAAAGLQQGEVCHASHVTSRAGNEPSRSFTVPGEGPFKELNGIFQFFLRVP